MVSFSFYLQLFLKYTVTSVCLNKIYTSPSISQKYFPLVVVVQSPSHAQFLATPWTVVCPASLSITISQNLLKRMSIESMIPSYHLILCHPLLLPPIFPSIRVFSNQSALCIRWPKYWSFSPSSLSPSNEYLGLISFRTDLFDLFAVQGTLKSLLQHHRSKVSILWCSTFFRVHLSHPYMPTGETVSLTRQTFIGKVMSLLFNMLSMFVIAFLRRGKHLLISWPQSPSAMILEPRKIKSVTVSMFPHLFAMKWWDQMPWS